MSDSIVLPKVEMPDYFIPDGEWKLLSKHTQQKIESTFNGLQAQIADLKADLANARDERNMLPGYHALEVMHRMECAVTNELKTQVKELRDEVEELKTERDYFQAEAGKMDAVASGALDAVNNMNSVSAYADGLKAEYKDLLSMYEKDTNALRAENELLTAEIKNSEIASEQALTDICKVIGAPEWEYPGQVVRDVAVSLGMPSAIMAEKLKGQAVSKRAVFVCEVCGTEWTETKPADKLSACASGDNCPRCDGKCRWDGEK